MLDNTARYVYEVYRLRSVSQAAEELYISQPALSAAIKRAEAELGAPIFNRKTLPFSLTPEGRVYMDAVEKMLGIEKQATNLIRQIGEVKQGTLRIGMGTHLSYFVLPAILKQFHRAYPQIDVRIEIRPTRELLELLEKDSVDLIIDTGDTPPAGYAAVTLLKERFVVAVPIGAETEAVRPYLLNYRELVDGEYGEDRLLLNRDLLHGMEFVYMSPGTATYKKRRLLLGESDISPYVVTSKGSQILNYNLMLAGLGALLTTDANVATMPHGSNCRYIALPEEQELCITYPTHVDSVVRDAFIETALARFADEPLTRLREI